MCGISRPPMTTEIGNDGCHGVLLILNTQSQYLQEWGIVVDLSLFQTAAVDSTGSMLNRHWWIACFR